MFGALHRSIAKCDCKSDIQHRSVQFETFDSSETQASKVLQRFHEDLSARLWFCYRTGFAPLGEDQLTSDVGWGCTLRSCQMLLAQARSQLHTAICVGADARSLDHACVQLTCYAGIVTSLQIPSSWCIRETAVPTWLGTLFRCTWLGAP